MRFLPFSILKAGIKKFNKDGFPAIFYIHPHDLDPSKPRTPGASWHNYRGLKEATKKTESILKTFRFGSAVKIITTG
jgi:hypothetical protein